MRIREFQSIKEEDSLNEGNTVHLRDFDVTVSLHAVDQAGNRNINIRHIDDILRNISKIKSSIMGLSLGSQFILHNGKGTGLGVRKLDGNKLLLATVYNTPAGFVKGKHSTFKVDTDEITRIPEGSEKFNDEVMRPGFRWSEEINGITYLVRTRWDNMPEVMARVNNREVGRATFIDHQTRSGLESVSTYVSPKWQGHGIAKNMYAVMRMLGANIQPSATQTAMGKDMWAKWKKTGDTKHLTSMNAKPMNEDSSNSLQTIIQSFVNSPIGQKYKQHDCKTVTRAFVQWAEQNKIPTQVVSLAPPSADFIAKNPRYKGKSGQGDGHIMPIVNGNAIDFTVRQFGVNRPFNNPLVTPTNSLPAIYGKFGYFTDKPEWFLGGKSHWIGALNAIPPAIFNQNFGDEMLEHTMAENFSDGRVKGKSRPGRVERSGASCDGSVSDLRSKAKNASGERAKMYHWCANMKSGRAKNESEMLEDLNVIWKDVLEAGVYKGYPCTKDCSGHAAGDRWADARDITDPNQCPYSNNSFWEGCLAHTDEQE